MTFDQHNLTNELNLVRQDMYNFLDLKLMPKVSCQSPATEFYEVTNLVSENELTRARGYLAYTVIKPPVEIEFEFLCPINIAYICLNTSVGTQRCTGIEIWAKTSSRDYTSIGKAVYDKSTLVFCNSRRYSKNNPPPLCNGNAQTLFFFKNDRFPSFLDATAVKLTIFRTERGCVPCLGSIKIFGDPSRTCSQTTVNTLKRIMGRTSSEKVTPPVEQATLTIPQDFMDDLTCEIMALPMTLPSGKTVDRDTLERHVENEKSFGRKPCDPFTGLKFTEVRKPVMNVALKSRIDMFLMQNCDNPAVKGVKRVLGGFKEGSSFKKIKLGDDCERKCGTCGGCEVLYVVPCGHFFCRQCLLTLDNCCSLCQRQFSKNEVERHY